MERGKSAVGRWIAGGSIVFPPFFLLPFPSHLSYKNIHARASRARARALETARFSQLVRAAGGALR